MPDTLFDDQDCSIDGSVLDTFGTGGTTMLDPVPDSRDDASEWSGARCEKCEAPLASDVVSICRRCGWYASLGTFVEVDTDWETELQPAPAAAGATQPANVLAWIRLLPGWSWIIIATVAVLAIESVAARFATPAGSSARMIWSLGQFTIGVVAAIGCHIFNFLVVAADDAEVGLLDLFLKPLKLWVRAVQNLPARLWVANSMLGGLTAAVLSLVVIGGIPYERFWDWGFKEPPKQDLMGAVMNRVKQLDNGKQSDDLEHAIGDFAGKETPDDNDKPKSEPAKPKNSADCVILGYFLDHNGQIATLLLGTADRGELIYAGNVAPKLPDDQLQALAKMLHAIETKQPIIKIDTDAIWVQPKYTCRVNFAQRTKGGHLRDVEWEKMLGSIEKR